MQTWSFGCFRLHLFCTQPQNRETVSTDLASFTWFPHRVFANHGNGWGGLQKMKKASSIGIPFEIQYIRTVSANVGIGLTAFGDLNPVQSFGGITLSLHLGQLP